MLGAKFQLWKGYWEDENEKLYLEMNLEFKDNGLVKGSGHYSHDPGKYGPFKVDGSLNVSGLTFQANFGKSGNEYTQSGEIRGDAVYGHWGVRKVNKYGEVLVYTKKRLFLARIG